MAKQVMENIWLLDIIKLIKETNKCRRWKLTICQ